MIVARIDKKGYFVEDIVLQVGEEVPSDCITERPNTSEKGFYKAKWTGTEWVEGLTQEEIEELNNQPKLPTTDDFLLDFEFRLSMLELGL